MLVSIATTLFVPKVLGLEQFGYWQLFIFYSSYVGFGHLGMNDGVYLIYGGITRDKIDKKSILSQMTVSLIFQMIVSFVILVALAFVTVGPERYFVIGSTAFFMLVQNTAWYFGYVFQAMNETAIYSKSCIVERLGFALPLIMLLLVRETSFTYYVVAYCFSSILQLGYSLWHARDFLKAGYEPVDLALKHSINSIRIGIKLMLANIASMSILGIARIIIDNAWGITTFGELSLSLSMVNFFLAFISQASMVLFPALRQSSDEDQKRFYYETRDAMSLIFPVAYFFYFPIRLLLCIWLPMYSSSLVYFAYLMPICIFDSKMNIACTTLLKVRREEQLLLIINIATTIVSVIGSLIGAYIFDSIYTVIIAATASIVGRSMVAEHILNRLLELKSSIKVVITELLLTIAFMVISVYWGTQFVGALIFLLVYILFVCFNMDKMKNTIRNITKIVKRSCG